MTIKYELLGMAWGLSENKNRNQHDKLLPLLARGFYYRIYFSLKMLYCPKDTNFVYFFITQNIKTYGKMFHISAYGYFWIFYDKKRAERRN